MKIRDLILVLMMNFAWGFAIIPSKMAMMHFTPLTATLLRMCIVFLLFWPLLKWQPGRMRLIFIFGTLSGTIQFSLSNTAIMLADNMNAIALCFQLGTPFSLLLAIFFLGERIHINSLLGIIFAFAGVIIISFDPNIVNERIALLLAIISVFSYSCSAIVLRQLRGVNPLTLQAWLAAVSIPVLLVLSGIFESENLLSLPQVPLKHFSYILAVTLLTSVAGNTILSYLLHNYPVTRVTPFALLAPLISILASTVILQSDLTIQLALGGIITMIGVGIIIMKDRTLKTNNY